MTILDDLLNRQGLTVLGLLLTQPCQNRKVNSSMTTVKSSHRFSYMLFLAIPSIPE